MFHSANVEVGTSWLASELGYASYLGQHFFFVPVGKVRLASAVRFGTVGIVNDAGGFARREPRAVLHGRRHDGPRLSAGRSDA